MRQVDSVGCHDDVLALGSGDRPATGLWLEPIWRLGHVRGTGMHLLWCHGPRLSQVRRGLRRFLVIYVLWLSQVRRGL